MTRIPVSIVTGFLGAGKTTLLNRLIATGALDRAALVINEFGDVGIDHLLIETAEEGIVELSGGCLCCSLRGDLADTLSNLAAREPAPDHIIIETTGLADPGPIAQTVIAHPVLNQQTKLAGIAALIDCADGPALLEKHEEARRQIALADRIIVTKEDVKQKAAALHSLLQAINPAAVITSATTETASLDWMISVSPSGQPAAPANHHLHNDIKSLCLSSSKAMPGATLELFLQQLIENYGSKLLRVKGFVQTTEAPEQPMLIQGVAQSFDRPLLLPRWPDDERTTCLVIIGHDLDKAAIRHLFDALTGQPMTDTPDRKALEESPLSVPGFL